MEKNRTAQIIAIIALVVGIAGLSIGFASFSSVLNIQSSANVKPDSSTMNVDFSSSIDSVELSEIVPTSIPNSVTATNGTIDNSNDPVYENVANQTQAKICTANEGTTDELVQKACENISVKVKVGNELETSSGKASITGHSLAKKTGELVTVTLEYAPNAERADGDFSVSFGNIALNYSSVD